jgi:polyadenylate-binding protein 2
MQEIRLMKQRVAEMEREAEKLRELQAAAESASTRDGSDGAAQLEDEKGAVDGRSVFVGNVRPMFQEFNAPWRLTLRTFSRVSCVQVDYSATPEELQAHFQACGTINRITILCDKFTGHPKGSVKRNYAIQQFLFLTHIISSRFAYVEFAEPDFVGAAMALDNSLFRGRLIKVRVYLPNQTV